MKQGRFQKMKRIENAFKKAKANAQDHLEKALEIAHGLPGSLFTEEIIQMFSSMDNRGN